MTGAARRDSKRFPGMQNSPRIDPPPSSSSFLEEFQEDQIKELQRLQLYGGHVPPESGNEIAPIVLPDSITGSVVSEGAVAQALSTNSSELLSSDDPNSCLAKEKQISKKKVNTQEAIKLFRRLIVNEKRRKESQGETDGLTDDDLDSASSSTASSTQSQEDQIAELHKLQLFGEQDTVKTSPVLT